MTTHLARCDRCKVVDTTTNKYLDAGVILPKGWKHVTDLGDLCVMCARDWQIIKKQFMEDK